MRLYCQDKGICCALQKEVMEGTASGSLDSSVLPGRCLAELWLLTRSLRCFHAILHLVFPLSHPSTEQPHAGNPPHNPWERHWRWSNAVVTVLGKPKGVYAPPVPLGIAFTKETHRQPGISPCPAKRDFFPHLSYFWLFTRLCCQQSGNLVSCHSTVVW